MINNDSIFKVAIACIAAYCLSCDFVLSYPEAVGKSLEQLIEYEGILFHFQVNVKGDSCSPGSSFELWTDNYGSSGFLDDNGQPKAWLPARHPNASGEFTFSEYSRNYYGKNNKPSVEDILPLMVYVRSNQTKSNLFKIDSSNLTQIDSTENTYRIEDLILECK
jgi:hypothetical protein